MGRENKTKTETTIDTLLKFKRWCSGRGKKYIAGQLPIDIAVVCDALTAAIDSMKHRVSHDDFKALLWLAESFEGELSGAEKTALKSARRVVRHINKTDSK